jgi:hypothetical protein
MRRSCGWERFSIHAEKLELCWEVGSGREAFIREGYTIGDYFTGSSDCVGLVWMRAPHWGPRREIKREWKILRGRESLCGVKDSRPSRSLRIHRNLRPYPPFISLTVLYFRSDSNFLCLGFCGNDSTRFYVDECDRTSSSETRRRRNVGSFLDTRNGVLLDWTTSALVITESDILGVPSRMRPPPILSHGVFPSTNGKGEKVTSIRLISAARNYTLSPCLVPQMMDVTFSTSNESKPHAIFARVSPSITAEVPPPIPVRPTSS